MNFKVAEAYKPGIVHAADGFRRLGLKLCTGGIFKSEKNAIRLLQGRQERLESRIEKYNDALSSLMRDRTPLGQRNCTVTGESTVKRKLMIIHDVKRNKTEEKWLTQKEHEMIIAKLDKRKASAELAAGFVCERLSRIMANGAQPGKELEFALGSAKHFENGRRPLRAARMKEHSLELLKAMGYTIDDINAIGQKKVQLFDFAQNIARETAELYARVKMHADSARMYEKAANLEETKEDPKALEIAWCLKNAGEQCGLAGLKGKAQELNDLSKTIFESPQALIEKAWNCVRGGEEYYPEANIHLTNALLRNPGEKLREEIKIINELMNWQGSDETIAILNRQDVRLN